MHKHSRVAVLLVIALIFGEAIARTTKPASSFSKLVLEEEQPDEEFTITIRRSDQQEATSGNQYEQYTTFMKNSGESLHGSKVERTVADDDPTNWDKVINIGKQIWDIIVKNHPAYEIKNSTANVVPAGLTEWQQLEHWKRPITVPYTVEYKNMLKMTVVNFDFSVVYIPGGQYKGKGQYLAGIAILPTNIDVTWGYSFNAKVEIPQVWNSGDFDYPLANAQLNLQIEFQNTLKVKTWFVKGDGTISELPN